MVSLQQQPQDFCATISALYQCFKKCSQCVVIKFLNKTFANLVNAKNNGADTYSYPRSLISAFIGLNNIYSGKVHNIHKYNVKIIGYDSKPAAYLDHLLDIL